MWSFMADMLAYFVKSIYDRVVVEERAIDTKMYRLVPFCTNFLVKNWKEMPLVYYNAILLFETIFYFIF